MTETSSLAITGIVVSAMAGAGLDPGLLFAGMAGGWWALSYSTEPLPFGQRITVGAVSALAGAWTAHPMSEVLAAWLGSTFATWWPADAGATSLRYTIALLVGLLAHRQLGPLIMRHAARLDSRGGKP